MQNKKENGHWNGFIFTGQSYSYTASNAFYILQAYQQ
jgi:hypothetical protein